MRTIVPPKKICKEFNFIYELKGAQKAIDVLARYYEIRRMKIVVNGRKVRNRWEASYDHNIAYFTKNGLNKQNVLHEFFHHLIYIRKLEMNESREERKANRFAREVIRSL